jgi:hypothetical protein
MRKSYFPGHSSDFLPRQRLGVGGNYSYLFLNCLAVSRVLLKGINVNKINGKRVRRVKDYLFFIIRSVIQFE